MNLRLTIVIFLIHAEKPKAGPGSDAGGTGGQGGGPRKKVQ